MSVKNEKYANWAEPAIVITIWLLVLALPIFILSEDGYVDWSRVIESWTNIAPFLILFLVNHFILVPYLLFRNYKIHYAIVVICLLIGITLFNYHLHLRNDNTVRNRRMKELREQNRYLDDDTNAKPRKERMAHRGKPFPFPPYVGIMIMSILIVGFDTGLRVFVKWLQLGKVNADLAKESMNSQLAFLRHQISPHFFMNTLNNIHALIDFDSEKAKHSVIQLSQMMRQLLYENKSEKVPLKNELEFLKNYIELMALRFTDKVNIRQQYPSIIPDIGVPPMLLTSIVENAFKHGVSYQSDSFIAINIDCTETKLSCVVENSKHTNNTPENEVHGIGLENTRKRLELLFDKDYTLEINDKSDSYRVHLTIPL